jgi:class 3 adenylate cyclase
MGTLINGLKLTQGQQHALRIGDELRIGPMTLKVLRLGARFEKTSASAISFTSVDFAKLDPQVVLKSTIKLPQLFGEAHNEAEVFQHACDYLVNALSPMISSAYVVETTLAGVDASRLLARRSLKDEGAPLLSRRVIEDANQEEGGVVFFHHQSPVNFRVTVADRTRTVGACVIEHTPAGDPVLIYVVGEQVMLEGQELAAEYLSLVSTLTRQHIVALRRANLTKYFSPKVVELLMRRGGRASAEGEPRVVEATSFFFDLRGFSLSAEASAVDLLPLHRDLKRAMDIVTHEVFAEDGTVIDYQGDGCFAAWGVPFEQTDHAGSAVRAATRIINRLSTTPLGAMATVGGGVCGIGIATGEVLAGSVGSSEHFKYGLLGPSVNLAARLESLTKPSKLHAPLLVTEAIAKALDAEEAPSVRAGRVVVAGIDTPINVYEVLTGERALASREYASRWEGLLNALEAARSLAAISKIREATQVGSFQSDPRVQWLLSRLQRLEEPGELERWDGMIRFAKD